MPENNDSKRVLALSDRTYDALVHLSRYWLPGFGTLYFTIANIWGLPYAEEIVGTLAALAIFIGVLIGVSKSSYEKSGAKYDGALRVETSPVGKDVYSLDIGVPLQALRGEKEIVLKVDASH